MSTADLSNLVSRLEVVVQRLESKAGNTGTGGNDVDLPEFIEEYDTFVSEFIDPYLKASSEIGGIVDEQAKSLKASSDELRKFLLVVAKCSEPKDATVVGKLGEGINKHTSNIIALKNKLDRKSNLVNHVRAASEGAALFFWIAYPKTPMKHVKETKDTVLFYTNKVLTEFKNKEDGEKHKSWVSSYIKIFGGLVDYIKQYHTTGPSWNRQGPAATTDAATPSAGGPPPPPPPPPPPAASDSPSKESSAASVTDLLKEINKGADVTKGLKKVTNDMKTHKNPELRKHHVPVPYKPQPTAYKPINKSAKQAAPSKPPVLQLDGKKWVVENHEKANLELKECHMKQTVYIYKCNNSTITITQKVNSIVLDSCKKTGIVFASVVSGVEVINCQSVQVQAQGQMHNVSIDKTDGCIVYLSKECLGAAIVTAKSSEMNVSIPKEDGDFDEFPIVEQFRSTYDSKKKTFITVPSEQLG